MNQVKAFACSLGAILVAGTWSQGNAQLSPKMQEEIRRSAPSSTDMKAQQDMMDKLAKENEERYGAMNRPGGGLPGIKPGSLEFRPKAVNAPGATQSAPAASVPPPSRVTYGESRPLSSNAGTKPGAESRPAVAEKPVAARAPERTPCVYKPVMTDADIAACR